MNHMLSGNQYSCSHEMYKVVRKILSSELTSKYGIKVICESKRNFAGTQNKKKSLPKG